MNPQNHLQAFLFYRVPLRSSSASRLYSLPLKPRSTHSISLISTPRWSAAAHRSIDHHISFMLFGRGGAGGSVRATRGMGLHLPSARLFPLLAPLSPVSVCGDMCAGARLTHMPSGPLKKRLKSSSGPLTTARSTHPPLSTSYKAETNTSWRLHIESTTLPPDDGPLLGVRVPFWFHPDPCRLDRPLTPLRNSLCSADGLGRGDSPTRKTLTSTPVHTLFLPTILL